MIFIQQLGRGLRGRPSRTPDRDRLRGNHRVFPQPGPDAALPGRRQRDRAHTRGGAKSAGAFHQAAGSTSSSMPSTCWRSCCPEARRSSKRRTASYGPPGVAGHGSARCSGRTTCRARSGAHTSPWFDFAGAEGDLTQQEQRVLERSGAWLRSLESTEKAGSFKMVVLEVLLERTALRRGMALDELAQRSHDLLIRSPELLRDIQDVKELKDPLRPSKAAWRSYWQKNPIAAWTGEGRSGRAWFPRQRRTVRSPASDPRRGRWDLRGDDEGSWWTTSLPATGGGTPKT